ncbi:hypothetical protein Tco_1532173 [Tanacetum coccineum]
MKWRRYGMIHMKHMESYMLLMHLAQQHLVRKPLRALGVNHMGKYVGVAVADVDTARIKSCCVLETKDSNILAQIFQHLVTEVEEFVKDLSKTGKLNDVPYTLCDDSRTMSELMECLLIPLGLDPVIKNKVIDKACTRGATQLLQVLNLFPLSFTLALLLMKTKYSPSKNGFWGLPAYAVVEFSDLLLNWNSSLICWSLAGLFTEYAKDCGQSKKNIGDSKAYGYWRAGFFIYLAFYLPLPEVLPSIPSQERTEAPNPQSELPGSVSYSHSQQGLNFQEKTSNWEGDPPGELGKVSYPLATG